MNAFRARLTGENRRLALWIVACALMLRMLVPAGWMPSTGADGAVRITLCTGQGPVEAWLGKDGALHGKAPQKSDPGTNQPCSFAGMGSALADVAAPVLEAPVVLAVAEANIRKSLTLFFDARNLTGKKAIGDISAVVAATPASAIYYPVERRAFYGGVRARF